MTQSPLKLSPFYSFPIILGDHKFAFWLNKDSLASSINGHVLAVLDFSRVKNVWKGKFQHSGLDVALLVTVLGAQFLRGKFLALFGRAKDKCGRDSGPIFIPLALLTATEKTSLPEFPYPPPPLRFCRFAEAVRLVFRQRAEYKLSASNDSLIGNSVSPGPGYIPSFRVAAGFEKKLATDHPNPIQHGRQARQVEIPPSGSQKVEPDFWKGNIIYILIRLQISDVVTKCKAVKNKKLSLHDKYFYKPEMGSSG